MKDYYIDDLDDLDTREFAQTDDGCLRSILSIITAVLLTAVLLWLCGCSPKISKPKSSWIIPAVILDQNLISNATILNTATHKVA